MKRVVRGAVLCFLLLLSLVCECECDDTELSHSRRELGKAEEKKQQQQTHTFTSGEEPNPQTDSHSINTTETQGNETLRSITSAAKATTSTPPTVKPILPVQTGVKAQEEEQSNGMSIFFSLLVIGICIVLVHLLIRFKLHFMPESVAVVSLGILMGAVIKIIETQELANWKMFPKKKH
ncbi:sodium/hydrogen exchanger 8 [Tachysurus ichikawai]